MQLVRAAARYSIHWLGREIQGREPPPLPAPAPALAPAPATAPAPAPAPLTQQCVTLHVCRVQTSSRFEAWVHDSSPSKAWNARRLSDGTILLDILYHSMSYRIVPYHFISVHTTSRRGGRRPARPLSTQTQSLRLSQRCI